MNTLHSCLAYHLLVINEVTFIVYGIDKYKAKKAKWRIPEVTLLLLAVLGGSIGAWMGMKVWHHKTMHKKFKLKNEVYEHYKEWDILEGHQAPDREIL